MRGVTGRREMSGRGNFFQVANAPDIEYGLIAAGIRASRASVPSVDDLVARTLAEYRAADAGAIAPSRAWQALNS